MAIKLTPEKPDDRYARMYYDFERDDDGTPMIKAIHEDEADEESAYIEFWAEDAKACRDAIRRITGRLYVIQERRDKRKSELTDEKAWEEIAEFNRLSIDGLAHRCKGWSLRDSDGNKLDVRHTFETAKELFADDDLRAVVSEFLGEKRNFRKRASDN